MIFYGKGIVWDAENDCILCKFKDGGFETEDLRIIGILKGLDLECEGEEPEPKLEDLKVAEIKAILDEKGIEYDLKAKKEELVELLKGAE